MPDYSYENIDRSIEQLIKAIDLSGQITRFSDTEESYSLNELADGVYFFDEGVTLYFTERINYQSTHRDTNYSNSYQKIVIRKTTAGDGYAILISGVTVLVLRQITTTNVFTIDSLSKKQNKLVAGPNITLEDTYNGETMISAPGGGGGGTSDYEDLDNKPSINGVELVGNKTLAQLGVQPSGDYATNPALTAEATARQLADNNLQSQIDDITVSSDVIDVVGTYAELVAYDTAHVTENDIIKVLQDSTHSNALSYYRWVITSNVGSWVYVGSEGPFYTKSEADSTFNEKLTAGTGITIQNNVISASVGTMDYTELENLPREPYTPKAETVDFLGLADGKVYDAMDDFTLARYNGQTVVTSIDVHKGDMFFVSEYNSTNGYSMIALFCNQGVFSFQSNLTDWSKGYLPNANDLYSSLAVRELPIDNNACNVSTLADGVYYATQTTTLTGWVSGTLNVSKNTQITKTNGVLFIGNEIYTGYDLSSVVKQNVEAGDIIQSTGNNTDKVVSQAAWTANIGLEVL